MEINSIVSFRFFVSWPIAFILGRPKTTGRTGSCTACVIVPELTVLDFEKVGVRMLWYGYTVLFKIKRRKAIQHPLHP